MERERERAAAVPGDQPAPESAAARAAAEIVKTRRLKPGESGFDAGLREIPRPKSQRGPGRPKERETPEERMAYIEEKKAKQRAYAKEYYRKKHGAKVKDKPAARSPTTGTRQAAALLIRELEAERDKLTETIEALRRYAG